MQRKPDIIYDLHDAAIVSASTGPRREVAVLVDLCPILYPERPRIALRFGGILNYESVSKYVTAIASNADRPYLGYRIDSFRYDPSERPTGSGYWFILEVDNCGVTTIHRTKMTMLKIER